MPELQYKDETADVSEEAVYNAARAISRARTLIITPGAGMSVDSGLPDFRGKNGLWQGFAEVEGKTLRTGDLAITKAFYDDAAQAWGFYGQLANLFRETKPHIGFEILRRWANTVENWYVVTSNVDGHFQKAGFETSKIVEIHGTMEKLQCLTPCRPEVWDNDQSFTIDGSTLRSNHVPSCNFCGGVARPNVLLFNDFSWLYRQSQEQEERFNKFLRECNPPITILEIGAGKILPSIRDMNSKIAKNYAATIIRINPHEWEIDAPHISIPDGAASGLSKIERVLSKHDLDSSGHQTDYL